ncbi:MAG: competence protein ComEC [Frankiaceae bacterium]|nr:competence protein ComEC [Frankiaceae bacterium]
MIALPAVACWGAAALLAGGSPAAAGLVALLAAAATAGALAVRRLTFAWLLLGVVIGAAATSLHLHALRSAAVTTYVGRRGSVPVELTLVRDPVELTSAGGFRFVLAAATLTRVDGRPDNAPVTVLAHGPGWLGLLPSQRLRVEGRVGPPRPGDPVAASVRAVGEPELVGRPRVWQRVAGRVRAAFRVATSGLPPDERGLVPGLVIGDTAAMPADLVDAFRSSGLTHLNAVSGENVAVVLATVGALLRRSWAGRRTRAAVSLLAIVGFVVLARPSPSVLRAATMGAIVVAGAFVGRRGQPLPALGAAVIALIAVDPFLARTPGFALSVLATGAIVLTARPVADRLARRMPRPLAIAVAVPLVAQIACTPVLVAAFGQLGPWAVPANVLAAPAVAPATVVGVACAVLAVPMPTVAHALAWVAAVPAGWLAMVARSFAALPGAGWRLPPGVATPAAVLVVVAALIGGALWHRRLHAMLGAWPP